jgi:hypothetical protein
VVGRRSTRPSSTSGCRRRTRPRGWSQRSRPAGTACLPGAGAQPVGTLLWAVGDDPLEVGRPRRSRLFAVGPCVCPVANGSPGTGRRCDHAAYVRLSRLSTGLGGQWPRRRRDPVRQGRSRPPGTSATVGGERRGHDLASGVRGRVGRRRRGPSGWCCGRTAGRFLSRR